jgi:hypothetical protein
MNIKSAIINRDSYLNGFIIGIILPVAAFGAFYLLDALIQRLFNLDHLLKVSNLALLAIAMNMLALRYYLVKARFERTGSSLMGITFVLGILYFVAAQGKFLHIF